MELNSRRIRCQESLNSSGLCVSGIEAPPFRPQQPAAAVGITFDLINAQLVVMQKFPEARDATFRHLIIRNL